jgi:hypothetical protein
MTQKYTHRLSSKNITALTFKSGFCGAPDILFWALYCRYPTLLGLLEACLFPHPWQRHFLPNNISTTTTTKKSLPTLERTNIFPNHLGYKATNA